MKASLAILVAVLCSVLPVAGDASPVDLGESGPGTGRAHYYRLSGELDFGPEEFVQAGGTDIIVLGYSVPSFVYWDGDGLKDLIVGEGGGSSPGKVRVYLNVGTASNPQFGGYFYAQSRGADLSVPAEGCLGAFPRVVYWNGDGLKDLLIGRADGTVQLFLNVATDAAPAFDSGTLLQVGQSGEKENIDVYYRATPTVVDWNNDGKKDLVVGSVDGLIYLFINEGTDAAPDFITTQFALMDDGSQVTVPTTRSSPHVCDLDGDGKKDLLSGDREGQLLFFRNTVTDEAPAFAPYTLVRSDGVPINLPDLPRSRPFVCYWTDDGLQDVLVGSGDGKVRLYQGVPKPGDIDRDGDVDLDDYAALAACLGGPETEPPPGCDAADLDDSGAVDLFDFRQFQLALPGA